MTMADGSAPDGTTADDGGGADNTCESIQIDSDPVPTHVLVTLDASASMYQPGNNIDRWNPAVEAVQNVTGSLEGRLRFGLMRFPGEPSTSSCSTGKVAVPTSLDNASDIEDALSGDPGTLTGGGTPTAVSLAEAGNELDKASGDKYVLLVTDGAPACNSDLDPETCTCVVPPSAPSREEACNLPENCLDDERTLTTIQDLASQGIGTYVIGFDTDRWSGVLDEMAAAGNTGRDTHIPVGDQSTLESALRDVSESTVPCTYELDMAPSDIQYVRVELDGTMVDHVSVSEDGSGWQLSGDKTVELVGGTCDTIQDGTQHQLNITVECEPVQLI
jgi:hypothetical protein